MLRPAPLEAILARLIVQMMTLRKGMSVKGQGKVDKALEVPVFFGALGGMRERAVLTAGSMTSLQKIGLRRCQSPECSNLGAVVERCTAADERAAAALMILMKLWFLVRASTVMLSSAAHVVQADMSASTRSFLALSMSLPNPLSF